MANKIQLMRGTKAQIAAAPRSLAEPVYATDTKNLYIGNSSGGDTLFLASDNIPYNVYRQALINPNMEIWQRTSSIANPATGAFAADRYLISYSADGGVLPTTITHQQIALSGGEVLGSGNAYRVHATGAGSGFGAGSSYAVYQRVEHGTRSLAGAGRKVTVSFWARSGVSGKRIGVALSQRYGTGGSPTAAETITGTIFTLSSAWTKYSYTFDTNTLSGKTFGTNADDFLQLGVFYQWGATTATNQFGGGTAETFVGTGAVDITQMQLCAGDVDLPFQPRSWAEELTLCQRYYEKSYAYSAAPGTSSSATSIRRTTKDGTAAAETYTSVNFKVRKRVAPTVTVYGASGTINNVNDGVSDKAVGSGSLVDGTSETHFGQNYTLASAVNAFRQFHYTADAEL